MPDKDPLEDLFRRSSEQLEKRPSLKGWHKLEQRLDGHQSRKNSRRRQHTQGFFKPWYYAAAAVALVIMIMVGLGKQSSLVNQKVLAQEPESIEDFELGVQSQTRIANYQAIPEGKRGEILTIRHNDFPKLLPSEKYRL